jgi:thioredoxin-related protein
MAGMEWRTMRNLKLFAATAIFVCIAQINLKAGVDPASEAEVASPFELIVLEADGCTYCRLFRRDVLPAYEVSEHGKGMPVRFVDVNDLDAQKLDLQHPVEIVPTFIVVKSRKEVGRIPGYVGPENFFHSIKYLLSTAP